MHVNWCLCDPSSFMTENYYIVILFSSALPPRAAKARSSKGKQSPENYEWRNKFKPIIHIPNEGTNSMERVLLERNPLCDIYWYKWPHDGYLFYAIPDYEPVVITFKGQSVYAVLTRPHWQYRPYRVSEGLSLPIRVMFKDASHAPYAKTIEGVDRFDLECKMLTLRDYIPEPVATADISEQYRTGKGHPSNFKLIVKDPLVRATEIYDEFKND